MGVLVFFFRSLAYKVLAYTLAKSRALRVRDRGFSPRPLSWLFESSLSAMPRGVVRGKDLEAASLLRRLGLQGLPRARAEGLRALCSRGCLPGLNIFRLKRFLRIAAGSSNWAKTLLDACFFFSSGISARRSLSLSLSGFLSSKPAVSSCLCFILSSRPSLPSQESARSSFVFSFFQDSSGSLGLLSEPVLGGRALLFTKPAAGRVEAASPVSRGSASPVFFRALNPASSVGRVALGVYSYFTGWSLSGGESAFFLRANSIYNKSRYSRNRQTYRTGVYWCMWLTVLSVVGLYYYMYVFLIKFTYVWYLFYAFVASFFLYYFKSRVERHWVLASLFVGE